MKEYYPLLQNSDLFKDIEDRNLQTMLTCLSASVKELKKNDIVLLAGDKPKHIGLVLSGTLHIVREDLEGNRSIVNSVGSGELFAEALCCANVSESPVSVFATSEAKIMLIDYYKILQTCPNCCIYHNKLIENLLKITANKNLLLQKRMEILDLKSLRAKILHLLESYAITQGENITLPFNREAMAAYLGVDRSALSHELMKMKQVGIIEYKKNFFKLK